MQIQIQSNCLQITQISLPPLYFDEYSPYRKKFQIKLADHRYGSKTINAITDSVVLYADFQKPTSSIWSSYQVGVMLERYGQKNKPPTSNIIQIRRVRPERKGGNFSERTHRKCSGVHIKFLRIYELVKQFQRFLTLSHIASKNTGFWTSYVVYCSKHNFSETGCFLTWVTLRLRLEIMDATG
jgi:hypothetical protein